VAPGDHRSADTVAVSGSGTSWVETQPVSCVSRTSPHQQRTPPAPAEHRQRAIDQPGKDAPALVGSPLQAIAAATSPHHRLHRPGQDFTAPIAPLLPKAGAPPPFPSSSRARWESPSSALSSTQLQRNFRAGVAQSEPATLPGPAPRISAAHHGCEDSRPRVAIARRAAPPSSPNALVGWTHAAATRAMPPSLGHLDQQSQHSAHPQHGLRTAARRQAANQYWPKPCGHDRQPGRESGRHSPRAWQTVSSVAAWRTLRGQGQAKNCPRSSNQPQAGSRQRGRWAPRSSQPHRRAGLRQTPALHAQLELCRSAPDDPAGSQVRCADQQPAESAGWPQPGLAGTLTGEKAAKETLDCLQTSTCTGPLRSHGLPR